MDRIGGLSTSTICRTNCCAFHNFPNISTHKDSNLRTNYCPNNLEANTESIFGSSVKISCDCEANYDTKLFAHIKSNQFISALPGSDVATVVNAIATTIQLAVRAAIEAADVAAVTSTDHVAE